jgi:acyl-CoA synthetase (AMP-forming)/AMP-acid ligase II
VAWLGPNHPAFLEALFASGLVGAALAPVNHRLAADGVRAVLADIEPSVLVQHAATDPTAVASLVRHRVAVASSIQGALDFEALVAESPDDAVEVAVGTEDVCLLPHTSGTTGAPKGVMLTHANLTWNVINFLSCADFRSDDVTVAIAPFFRVGGTGVNVLPVLFLGGTVVVPSDLRPDGILQVIQRHRVTVGFGNPDLLDDRRYWSTSGSRTRTGAWWGRGRRASCWCAAPTSWPAIGGDPRPPARSCQRTAGCGPATRREATSRGTCGSWIGWRTASSRMAGPSTRATWSGC